MEYFTECETCHRPKKRPSPSRQCQLCSWKVKRRFTDQQIRDMRDSGRTVRELARQYDCAPNMVQQVQARITYRDVT